METTIVTTSTGTSGKQRSPARRWLVRLFVAAGILAVGQLAVLLIGSTWDVASPQAPQIDLRRWPLRVGDWTGRKTTVDARLIRASEAALMENWLYRNPEGEEILVHFGIWTQYEMEPPHLPAHCYRGAGWELLEETTVRVGEGEQDDGFAALCHRFERDGQQVQVLTWYEYGPTKLTHRGEVRQIWQQARGAGVHPPAAKFMLQTEAGNPEAAINRLKPFAVRLEQAARPLLAASQAEVTPTGE